MHFGNITGYHQSPDENSRDDDIIDESLPDEQTSHHLLFTGWVKGLLVSLVSISSHVDDQTLIFEQQTRIVKKK